MIKWENVLVFDIPAVCTLGVAWLGYRASMRNERKLHSIDRAVNGTVPGEATLQDNVRKINEAVNGNPPGVTSIQDNVKKLVDR
jgi:hypothetical protein